MTTGSNSKHKSKFQIKNLKITTQSINQISFEERTDHSGVGITTIGSAQPNHDQRRTTTGSPPQPWHKPHHHKPNNPDLETQPLKEEWLLLYLEREQKGKRERPEFAFGSVHSGLWQWVQNKETESAISKVISTFMRDASWRGGCRRHHRSRHGGAVLGGGCLRSGSCGEKSWSFKGEEVILQDVVVQSWVEDVRVSLAWALLLTNWTSLIQESPV